MRTILDNIKSKNIIISAIIVDAMDDIEKVETCHERKMGKLKMVKQMWEADFVGKRKFNDSFFIRSSIYGFVVPLYLFPNYSKVLP